MTISRRKFISAVGALSAVASIGCRVSAEDSQGCDKSALTRECWMDSVIDAAHASTTPLHLGRFADPIYFLLDEISWSPDKGGAPSVTVPANFVTDLASVPRIFWSTLRPDGDYAFAAILHDYLYWEQPSTIRREDADAVLKSAMEEFKVSSTDVTLIFNAVRAGGGSAWDENRKLKLSGEKRILKKLPSDPKMRWAEWKNRPGVFG